MNSPAACPKTERWKDLLDENLPADDVALLQEHLEGCDHCQGVLEELVADREAWATMAQRLAQGEPKLESLPHGVIDDIKAEVDPAKTLGHEASDSTVSLDFLTPTVDPSFLGQLGPYQVTQVLGRGGMGVVLKAHDAELNRFVAIKVLAPTLASNATARKRFRREGQAAATVSHEHVVTIHAVDEAAGLPFLVMECISGRSLEDRIQCDGPLKLEEILRIGMQAAAGLAAAHAQGLVHRDIKPGNILLENGVERVKITDFGLARAVDDVQLTQPGVVAGTPEYMSPEQARGGSIDRRTANGSFF